MTADMLTSPRWQAADLGFPMPDSPHAASACLPLWKHNIQYEEGTAAVVDALKAAYPRFCLHPFVRQLCQRTFGGDGSHGLVFPSARCARRALDYVRAGAGHSGGQLVALPGRNAVGVAVAGDDRQRLKQYWQHSGEILSSRVAERILQDQPAGITDTAARRAVIRRVAALHRAAPRDVRLFPTGMAGIATLWRCVRHIAPDHPTVQFGFPYVDTLKIQERFARDACLFFSAGTSDDVSRLKSLLTTRKISALFVETPTNPLLVCPDLPALRWLADEHGFLLIVDDTLGACLNLHVMPFADAVVTSLTKYFSGYGDVLAGSVVLNAARPQYRDLQAAMLQEYESLLCDADVEVLEKNSRDLPVRIACINRNAVQLARHLSAHPLVERVFHPSIRQESSYDQLCVNGGTGGLMSIILRDAARNTPRFFDALEVCKGPNLGTNFTLCCPYTILAHYHELPEVEAQGVSRWLLRISAGTEEPDDLCARFDRALAPLAGPD